MENVLEVKFHEYITIQIFICITYILMTNELIYVFDFILFVFILKIAESHLIFRKLSTVEHKIIEMIENVASIYTFKRSFSKLVDLDSSDLGDVQEALIRNKRHHSYAWTISDALSAHKITKPSVKLPLKSFNHVAREGTDNMS